MAFKSFSAGDVLTASDVNTYLMQQAVITCTSATRPASPVEGMTIYETDTDKYLTYSGSAWENMLTSGGWTTGAVQLGSRGAGTDWAIGTGTVVSRYIKVGRLYVVDVLITFAASSTFGTKALFLDDIPEAATPLDRHIGTGAVYDSSPVNRYQAFFHLANTTEAGLNVIATSGSYATGQDVTSTVPITFATGDQISARLIYEGAS